MSEKSLLIIWAFQRFQTPSPPPCCWTSGPRTSFATGTRAPTTGWRMLGRTLLARTNLVLQCKQHSDQSATFSQRDDSVRCFLDHSMVSRIESKGFQFFLVELWVHFEYRRVRQDYSTTYEDSIGSILQPWETGYYIKAAREQNASKIFRLSRRKILLCVFSCVCAKWVKSCSNSVNIGTTWKNLRSFRSILDRMQWAKKPYHATVPLRGVCGSVSKNNLRLYSKRNMEYGTLCWSRLEPHPIS